MHKQLTDFLATSGRLFTADPTSHVDLSLYVSLFREWQQGNELVAWTPARIEIELGESVSTRSENGRAVKVVRGTSKIDPVVAQQKAEAAAERAEAERIEAAERAEAERVEAAERAEAEEREVIERVRLKKAAAQRMAEASSIIAEERIANAAFCDLHCAVGLEYTWPGIEYAPGERAALADIARICDGHNLARIENEMDRVSTAADVLVVLRFRDALLLDYCEDDFIIDHRIVGNSPAPRPPHRELPRGLSKDMRWRVGQAAPWRTKQAARRDVLRRELLSNRGSEWCKIGSTLPPVKA